MGQKEHFFPTHPSSFVLHPFRNKAFPPGVSYFHAEP